MRIGLVARAGIGEFIFFGGLEMPERFAGLIAVQSLLTLLKLTASGNALLGGGVGIGQGLIDLLLLARTQRIFFDAL